MFWQRFLAVLILAGLLVPGLPALASPSQVQVTVDKLNVRSGPGLTYKVVSQIPANTKLPVVKEEANWYQVKLPNGGTGWLAAWLVKPQTSSTTVPNLPTANSSKTATASATYIQATTDDLNVRSGPGLTFPVVQTIDQDSSYPVLQKNGQWVKIKLSPNQDGWVAGWLIAEKSGAQSVAPSAGGHASIQSIVLREDTSVYASPDSDAPVIGQVSKGDTISVEQEQSGWYKITYDGQAGWIHTDPVSSSQASGSRAADTTPIPTVPQQTQGKATILNPDTNIRSGPGTAYQIIKRVQAGEQYPILATEGEWFRIQLTDGTSGYVAGWLVNADGVNNVIHGDVLKNKVIVVDPGHGGEDTGALGTSFATLEKTINLQVATALKKKLEAAGAKVIMTRSDDRRLTLQQRVDIAVQNKADLFVSVHHNTAPNSSANGTIIFYYKEGKSSKLASLVQSEVVKATKYQDLHAQFGNYFVLRENPIVSILCEIGFITNYEEELRLRSSKQQDLAAEGIYKGIVKYFASEDGK